MIFCDKCGKYYSKNGSCPDCSKNAALHIEDFAEFNKNFFVNIRYGYFALGAFVGMMLSACMIWPEVIKLFTEFTINDIMSFFKTEVFWIFFVVCPIVIMIQYKNDKKRSNSNGIRFYWGKDKSLIISFVYGSVLGCILGLPFMYIA